MMARAEAPQFRTDTIDRLMPLAAAAAAVTIALIGPGPAGGRSMARDLTPYRGLGTWVDIYSPAFRTDARSLAATLAARGVRTLFLETGNYRQRVDVVRPQQVGALIDAAHAQRIAVVAWYLPFLTAPTLDRRRALASIRFTSASGQHFDSFALDIEASLVRNVSQRNRRLLALSSRLRAAVGATYPLGAIIPSPVGMQLLPHYWPRFPYAALTQSYDVFLPMPRPLCRPPPPVL